MVRRGRWMPLLVALAALVLEFGYPLAAMAYQLRRPPATGAAGVPGSSQSCTASQRPGASGAGATCQSGGTAACPAVSGSGLSAGFGRYARSTRDGWTGGDSTYSVALGDGRILWVFSDTFLGPLNEDGTRPAGAVMVNNSFVVQDGARLTTVDGGTPGHPAAIMPPDGPGRWYWAGDGMLTGTGLLQVVFREYRRTGPGAWDFTFSGSVVATFSPRDLSRPVSVDPLSSGAGVAWGAALLPASRSGDGYTYVYGMLSASGAKTTRVARVPGDDLRDGPWQYRTECGWSSDERAVAAALSGVADEYSVVPWRGRYLLVTTDGTGSGDVIEAFTSRTPWGPFATPVVLYRMPEVRAGAARGGEAIIGYNAHAHPELSCAGTLLVSYNVNSLDDAVGPEADDYRDPGIYRPRFVELHVPSATT